MSENSEKISINFQGIILSKTQRDSTYNQNGTQNAYLRQGPIVHYNLIKSNIKLASPVSLWKLYLSKLLNHNLRSSDLQSAANYT